MIQTIITERSKWLYPYIKHILITAQKDTERLRLMVTSVIIADVNKIHMWLCLQLLFSDYNGWELGIKVKYIAYKQMGKEL